MSDIRSQLPASLRPIMQNGLLERTFMDALFPELLFPQAGSLSPVEGRVGAKITQTRTGLLTPTTTSLAGADPSPQNYSVEQWDVILEDYGNTMDTDKLASGMAIASKFLEDIQKLGLNAGQSLNRIARGRLYDAYAGGRTWATAAGTTSTSLAVDDATGFGTVLVNGVPTAVSASNPLTITIGGASNTVTGVSGNTLTLGTAVSWSQYAAVVAANAPYSIRAGTGNESAYDVGASDVALFKHFRAAVVRLRKQNVPTIGGYYVAHVSPETENQLFDDTEFQNVINTNIESPQWRDLAIGTAGGIVFVRNNETIVKNNGTIDVHRPIVMGAGAMMNAPYANYLSALRGDEDMTSGADVREISVGPSMSVALIVRPPQDRMQRYIGSSWGWVGDFGIPSDSVTGDAALFKRAVMIEHA